MKPLTKKERAALAMHELMKRDQARLRQRIEEQQKINMLSDDELKKIVEES